MQAPARAAAGYRGRESMLFIRLYLVVYFLLLFGAVAALWRGGVLQHVSGVRVAILLVIGVALGVLLLWTSMPRRVSTTDE